MTAWLHMLAWWDLEPAAADGPALALRARLVSVAMALLAVAATFWAGMSLGGVRTARLAAMVLGTTLLFIHQARAAAPEAVLVGFSTLAVAAGLWAIRPLGSASRAGRRVVGWLIAGGAMGAAILTKGPIALLFIAPPLLAAIALTPRRRTDSTIGLLFALTLGATLTSPWYLYVLDRSPDAWEPLLGHYGAPADLFLLTWSHARVAAMLSPWQVLLVGALCQPFLRVNRLARRQLLIAWFWFVLLAVAFSIPAARDPRYLMPILPAAALMIGQLWSYHARLAAARQDDPAANLLRTPHWLLIGLASILGPLLIALQPELIRTGWLDRPLLPGLGWPAALGLGVALLAIAIAGTRWHFKWRPRLAAYATIAWMIVASTTGFYAHAQAPAPHKAHHPQPVGPAGGWG